MVAAQRPGGPAFSLRLERALLPGARITTETGAAVRPVHARAGLYLRWRERVEARVGLVTPLGAVLRDGGVRWLDIPWQACGGAGGLIVALLAPSPRAGGRVQSTVPQGAEKMAESHGQPAGSQEHGSALPVQATEQLVAEVSRASGAETLAAALAGAMRPAAVVGQPISHGAYTAVPLLETMFGGGYGMGTGSAGAQETVGAGGGGGGGGAGGRSRVVAVLEIGPDGVVVRPVVDTTKLWLAAIGAGVGLLAVLRRFAR